MYQYQAKVIDVYDGDTITAQVDLGFHASMKIKVRLFGINAPEVRGESKEEGLKSKTFLSDLVLNKTIMLSTKKDKQEKYGRWLGVIFVKETYPNEDGSFDDINVNEQMVLKGFTIPYMES